MDYIGSHESVNWLFVLALLSILQWILTIIFVSKKYHLMGKEISNNAFPSSKLYKEKIPFMHDYFYIYWNIYPIIFYAFFYYVDTSWDTYLKQIIMIGGDNVKILYDSFFVEFSFSKERITISNKWVDLLVLIIVATLAFFSTFRTQIKKQILFLNQTDKLYWWDIRISKELYWIRFIFLFFNMVLVGFIAYLMTKVAIFVLALLSMGTTIFNINPFHPDLFGGLRVLMEISSVILAIYLLRAMLGIVGLLDHRGVKDTFQFIGDLYHAAYFFLGIGFIVTFVYKVDNILSSVNLKDYLSSERFSTFNIETHMSNVEIANKASSIADYYDNLLQFNKFPIDLSLFASSIFTFALPLSVWFFIKFMDNRIKSTDQSKSKHSEQQWKAYLISTSGKLQSNIFLIILSLTIYTLWYLCGLERLFSYSYLHLSLGHIGYLGLLLIPAFLAIENSFLQKLWIFFAGLALLDLPTLVYITNNKDIDNSIFLSSINFTIIIFISLTAMLYSISKSQTSTNSIIRIRDLIIIFLSSAFFISLYHGVNYYLKEIKNIANIDRSVFIGNLEFHHINYGIILLVLVPFLFRYTSKLSGIYMYLGYIFIGFIYASVFDEAFYYMLQDVSDNAYFAILPNFISFSIMITSFTIWFFIVKKNNR